MRPPGLRGLMWCGCAFPLLAACCDAFGQTVENSSYGLERRVSWTTSRVVGSPDPPLPYTVEKTFTNIQWRSPLFLVAEPHSESLLVVLQGGEKERPSKILRVRDAPGAEKAESFLQMSNRLIYSVEFHPDYRRNGFLYVFSNGPTPQGERTNRISRFTVARASPFACEPSSEKLILEWRSAGHDGGGLVFGRDGMLYISSGDGTSDSDTWNSGQTVDDLLGGVLRIDVDAGNQPYAVPADNPFVGWTNARPELWAYGLRNPWRMTADARTGHIWVGNNGQDLWETVHLLGRGENYGWSVYEGSHPFYLNRKLGPNPPVAPTIEHHHAEARSLTGGVVYYGSRLPQLEGVYVYGDYSSGIIWGARHDGRGVAWHKELARTELQIAAFATSHGGELLVVDHGGGIYRLLPATPPESARNFPTRLSETGLFLSTENHQLDPGVLPYSVRAPAWADGARVDRFIALPGQTQVSNGWNFPNGTVLGQTLSLERKSAGTAGTEPASRRRLETRLLTRQQGQWVGYSYRWNGTQTDATLVGAKGEDLVVVANAAGRPERRQVWRYPSRAECMACHSRAANFVLGFTPFQLDRPHDYGETCDNQLRTLHHIGLLAKRPESKHELVNPYDAANALEARARAYLHVNCSVCHVEAGGGNARLELGITAKTDRMNVIGAWPQHDSFGLTNAMLIAPGEPERSVLLARVARRGRGQMPPLVSNVVDEEAIALLRAWIASLKPAQAVVRDWQSDDLFGALKDLKQGRSFERGREAFRQTGCNQCHRFAGEGGAIGPDLTAIGKRATARELIESIVLPSKVIAEGYAAAGNLSTMPTGLLNTLEEGQVLDLLAYLIADGDPKHELFPPASSVGAAK